MIQEDTIYSLKKTKNWTETEVNLKTNKQKKNLYFLYKTLHTFLDDLLMNKGKYNKIISNIVWKGASCEIILLYDNKNIHLST